MSLRAAFLAAAADFYHQLWRLAALNTLFGAILVSVALAAVALRPAVLLIVLVGPFAAALMHCSVTVAQTDELHLGEALVGFRRCWRRGLALAALAAGAAVLGIVAVPFYAGLGIWAWPLAALTAYLVVAFLVFQLALWPFAVLEQERSLADVFRDAARTVLRRPLGFAGLALALLLVNAVGLAAAVLPFLTLTIAFSSLASAHFSLPTNPAREA
jgi:hypothetical protein